MGDGTAPDGGAPDGAGLDAADSAYAPDASLDALPEALGSVAGDTSRDMGAEIYQGLPNGGTDGAAADSMEKLYGPANIAKLTSYSWNIFRYVGDGLHLFGVVVLLTTLAKNQSCQGISRSTQILYFVVFTSRYLDLVDHSQHAYLVFFKLTYIITSIIVLYLFYRWDVTYDRRKDTCSLSVIFIPCATAAVLLANELSAIEMLWSFSQFLEGFAMVPQYIFCYRDGSTRDWGVGLYVASLGGYRVFYAANWIYKKVQMPQYSDVQSWIGGLIEIMFFCDYILSRVTGTSLLRTFVLKVDDKIKKMHDIVESMVVGPSREEISELRRRHRAQESLDV